MHSQKHSTPWLYLLKSEKIKLIRPHYTSFRDYFGFAAQKGQIHLFLQRTRCPLKRWLWTSFLERRLFGVSFLLVEECSKGDMSGMLQKSTWQSVKTRRTLGVGRGEGSSKGIHWRGVWHF